MMERWGGDIERECLGGRVRFHAFLPVIKSTFLVVYDYYIRFLRSVKPFM